ncbi:protease [Pedobacter sp. JCM 36344]|uniref:protease n=1 Tax=Pedobacter sp. JCM 36344 TaxID=3374280 RepID=UPI00397848BA
MKNSIPILAAVALASCSQKTRNAESASADSAALDNAIAKNSSPPYAKMIVSPTIKMGKPVQMRFTVHNDADSIQQFCKWHSVFNEQANYKGAMATRVMPPPANSYVKIEPKDSLSVIFDLAKGYDITELSTYKLGYNAQNMSRLIVKDSVSVYWK